MRKVFLALIISLTTLQFYSQDQLIDTLFTPQEIMWLQEQDRHIRYAPNPSWGVGDFIDEEGNHRGIVADYIEIFEEKLGITFQKVYFDSWLEIIEELKNGEVDFVGAIQQTEERDEFLIFSDNFMHVPLLILTRNGTEIDLEDLKKNELILAGVSGYTSTDYVRNQYPGILVKEYSDDLTALLQTSLGNTDGTISDMISATYLVQKYGINNLQLGWELDFSWNLRFACRKELPELISILNKLLQSVSLEEQQEIKEKWVGSFGKNENHIELILIFAGILVILFLMVLTNNAVLKNRVRNSTKELNQQLIEKEQMVISVKESESKLFELNHFTSEILLLTDLPAIYQYLTSNLHRRYPKAIILYVSVNTDNKTTKFEFVAGLEKSLLTKFIKLSGFDPVGKEYRLTDHHYNYFKSGNFVEFDGGLSDFAASEFPALAAQTIERLARINNIYTIGINKDETLLGAIHFFARKNYRIKDEVFIEAIVRQAGLVIQRVMSRDELTAAKEKAEESDRLKSLFLQNMSHEVRTPLNAIVGFSQLMAESDMSRDKFREFSGHILTGSEKLTGIIRDIIEMSQIQTNQMQFSQSEFDIAKLVESVLEKFTEFAGEKKLLLKIKQEIPEEKRMIISDKDKMKTVLTHLLDNSIKFTPKGTVELISDIRNDQLFIQVTDTGIGISPETQKVIFEPFRQFETEMHRRYGGNGLGLSLVKAYVELLVGAISLDSKINNGTSVTLLFPLDTTTQGMSLKRETVQPSIAGTPKKSTSTKTILIAEDEYANYLYLKAIIDNKNVTILHAVDGQEAIDLCRSNNAIDMILMDIKMPVMDGYTAAKMIKEFRPGIPIIAQTAYAMESEKQHFADVFDDYFTKPIDKKSISKLLENNGYKVNLS
jgi:signal transduction histidine kinase/ABC-type amino acid transport substrate-binding protein